MNRFLTICLVLVLSSLLNNRVAGQGISWASFSFDDPSLPPTGGSGSQVLASAIDHNGSVYAAYYSQTNLSISGQIYQAIDSSDNSFLVKYDRFGNITWVKHLAPEQGFRVQVSDMLTDGAGNLFVAGIFRKSIVIDDDTLTSPAFSGTAANHDYFLAKWDVNGNLQWAVNGGGNGGKFIYNLSLSPTGEVLAAGSFNGVFPVTDFGPFALSSTAQNIQTNGFLLKFSSSGQIIWAYAVEHSTDDSGSYIRNVQHDSLGNIYIKGTCYSPPYTGSVNFSFQGITFTSGDFWMKFNSLGQHIWSKPVFNHNYPHVENMLVDEAGYTYMTGSYIQQVDVGGIIFTPPSTNWASSIYVAKYDANGVLLWARNIEAAVSATSYVTNLGIALDQIGNLYITGYFNGTIAIGNQQLISASSNSSFLSAINCFTGEPVWSKIITNDNDNVFCMVKANPTGEVLLAGGFLYGPISFNNTPLTGHGPTNSNQTFLARVVSNFNSIQGKVFVDQNLNMVCDSTENGFPGGTLVGISPGQFPFITYNSGLYIGTTDVGNYSINVPNPPLYYNLIPTGQTSVSFSNYGNSATGFDFALQPIPNQQDIALHLTPFTPARPGFGTRYRLTYKNIGTSAIPAGQLNLNLNPSLSFDSSSHTATQTGNTLNWNYTNLQPTESRNIDVYLTLSALAQLADTLLFTATVEPLTGDLAPINNSDSLRQVIIGSYDPNEIEVNHTQLSPQQVQGSEWLEYIIRFQNMGTDTAFTVMLRDSLSSGKLNLGTIEMLSSSHNYTWNLDANGIMTVLFTGIKLPHETINEPASHGFVRFRVRPQQGLAVGEIIPNQAKIYFDYNPYIATNTATTEIIPATGIEPEVQANHWKLYPNPANDKLFITNPSTEKGIIEISLVNVLGQEVKKIRAAAEKNMFQHVLNLQQLPKGLFIVKIKTAYTTVSKAIVRQ